MATILVSSLSNSQEFIDATHFQEQALYPCQQPYYFRTYLKKPDVVLVWGKAITEYAHWERWKDGNYDLQDLEIWVRSFYEKHCKDTSELNMIVHLGGEQAILLENIWGDFNTVFQNALKNLSAHGFFAFMSSRGDNVRILDAGCLLEKDPEIQQSVLNTFIQLMQQSMPDAPPKLSDDEAALWDNTNGWDERLKTFLSRHVVASQNKKYDPEPFVERKRSVNTIWRIGFGKMVIDNDNFTFRWGGIPEILLQWLTEHLPPGLEVTNNEYEADVFCAYLPTTVLLRTDTPLGFEPKNITSDRYVEKPNRPIIMVGVADWMHLLGKTIFHESFTDLLDGRYRFFDASIWRRYLPVQAIASYAKGLFSEYVYLLDKGVFDVGNTHENLDFLSRLFKTSYILSPTLNRENKRHGERVLPFTFHAESKMRQKALQFKKLIPNLHWRMLLIDDQADASLPVLKDTQNPTPLQKVAFIKDLFRYWLDFHVTEDNNTEAVEDKITISIETVTTLSSAKNKLEPESNNGLWYDMVLIDYLFTDDTGNAHTFGDRLITEMFTDGAFTEKPLPDGEKGPLGKYWFLPISVYGRILTDKLHDEGLSDYNKDFVLANGSDLLTTPWLFLQNVVERMYTQLREVFYLPKDPDPKFRLALFETFNFEEQRAITGNITAQYLSIFPELVAHGVQFKRLIRYTGPISETDRRPKSALAKSIFDRFYLGMKFYDWEHLQNLVYLIAHGSHHQRGQMWDEYQYVERSLSFKVSDLTDDDPRKKGWKNILEKLQKAINQK